MPLIHFNLPWIFQSATAFGDVLRNNLPQIEAVGTPQEYITDQPDKDGLESAHLRLVQSLIPYPDLELTDRLVRDLTSPLDLPQKGLPSAEECERLEAGSRLLRDCECAAEGQEAGQAHLALALLLMEWLHHDDARTWLVKLGNVVRDIWSVMQENVRRGLAPEYQAACAVWGWPLSPTEGTGAPGDQGGAGQGDGIAVTPQQREERNSQRGSGEAKTGGKVPPSAPVASRSSEVQAGQERTPAPVAGGSRPSDGDTPSDWPPSQGWGFRPGEAAYNGNAFPLTGVGAKLLKRLFQAKGGPVAYPDLKRACDNELIEDGTLRGYVSDLQTALRQALSLPKTEKIIQQVERWPDAAYRLRLL